MHRPLFPPLRPTPPHHSTRDHLPTHTHTHPTHYSGFDASQDQHDAIGNIMCSGSWDTAVQDSGMDFEAPNTLLQQQQHQPHQHQQQNSAQSVCPPAALCADAASAPPPIRALTASQGPRANRPLRRAFGGRVPRLRDDHSVRYPQQTAGKPPTAFPPALSPPASLYEVGGGPSLSHGRGFSALGLGYKKKGDPFRGCLLPQPAPPLPTTTTITTRR